MVLFPPRVECQKCGWMVKVKWLPPKLLPAGIDGIGVSKCPRCRAKATHLAGDDSDQMMEVADTLYFKNLEAPEIAITDGKTGKAVKSDLDNG